jgi:hypothetical protein
MEKQTRVPWAGERPRGTGTRGARCDPVPSDPAEFLRRFDAVVRRVRRRGQRGLEAEGIALALLVPEDDPSLLQPVSGLDARSRVRTERRAAERRRWLEREAVRSILEDFALIERTRGGAPIAP